MIIMIFLQMRCLGAKLCMMLDLLGDSGSVTGVDAARHRLAACRTTTTTKPYPTKWGRLHGSNYAIVFYHKPNLDPTH